RLVALATSRASALAVERGDGCGGWGGAVWLSFATVWAVDWRAAAGGAGGGGEVCESGLSFATGAGVAGTFNCWTSLVLASGRLEAATARCSISMRLILENEIVSTGTRAATWENGGSR